MNDALSGKIGKAHSSGMGWEYILALRPVGGSHCRSRQYGPSPAFAAPASEGV